jgi:hypothetical protein
MFLMSIFGQDLFLCFYLENRKFHAKWVSFLFSVMMGWNGDTMIINSILSHNPNELGPHRPIPRTLEAQVTTLQSN